MKKYLLLLVCCLMLTLVGCKRKLYGEWVPSKVEMGGVEISFDDLGFDAEDLTIKIEKGGIAYIAGEKCDWEKDGKAVVFTYEGEEIGRATIDGKELRVEESGMIIIYKKK